MSLTAFYTYTVGKDKDGFDTTTKSETQVYLNKDHIVTIRDLSLNFNPESGTSYEEVSKVTFCNALSLIISKSDANTLK